MHWLVTLAITLALLGGAGVAALAWRLSEGPVDLPWLATRLESAANANGGPTRLAIGSVALTWEGFRLGVDRPLDLRVTNVTVSDQTGRQRMDIPRAEVSLSLRALLRGRIEPRGVEMDGPRLTLLRAADGKLSLDLGSLTEASDSGIASPAEPANDAQAPINALLAELAQPAANDRDRSRNTLTSQLRLLRIRDARVVVLDRQLGITWRAPKAEIDLTRKPQGGVDGTADLSLALGEQQARLTVSATLAAGATETHLRARLTPVKPAALAHEAPTLAALAAVDAPVSGEADLDLDANLALLMVRLTARAGAGDVRIGQASVPIVEAALAVSGTPDALTLQTLQATLRGHEGGPQTQIQARGTARARVRAAGLGVDARSRSGRFRRSATTLAEGHRRQCTRLDRGKHPVRHGPQWSFRDRPCRARRPVVGCVDQRDRDAEWRWAPGLVAASRPADRQRRGTAPHPRSGHA